MSRRQTLGVLSDAQLNSSLPQPSAASKSAKGRPSLGGGRASLAPGRASMAGGKLPGMGGNGMNNIVDGMAGLSVNQNSRTSDVRNSSIGRRTSYAPRPSQIGIPTGPVILKDPRPIREKQWQANAIRTLINFLVQTGYSQAISAKALQAPSAKDFQTIFKFLYAQLDPSYVYQKKFEEEVPVLLKGIRYPFADQISKSHLYSVGSMHSWPTLLAMLTWMVELILCCDQLDQQAEFDDGTGLHSADNPEKIFYDYLVKTYELYISEGAELESMDYELMANFDRKNEMTLGEIERLKKEHEILSAELKTLTETESPLITLEKERVTLSCDREKFKQYITYLESKKQKLSDQVTRLHDEIEAKELELKKLNDEKAHYQNIVDNQELSPADVDRMNAEREQLKKSLEMLAAKAEQVNQMVWEKEILLQKKMDQLEKLIQEYNSLVYRLGLSNPDSPMANGIKFEIELNVHASKPEQMVSVDLRNTIKPALGKLRSKFNALFHKAQEESLSLQETLDRLSETVADKLEELASIENKIRSLNEQYQHEKEAIGAENSANNSEIESLERQLQAMRFEGTTELLMMQQKAQKITIEYDQLLRKANETKERVGKEIVKVLEEMLAFQTHISNSLNDLEKVALENLNGAVELATQENVEGGAVESGKRRLTLSAQTVVAGANGLLFPMMPNVNAVPPAAE